jgi:uncharacterized iron-regulated membrane protein
MPVIARMREADSPLIRFAPTVLKRGDQTMFRKVIFWLHLILGIAAGVIILIMSATGVLLMYEKQMIAWADRSYLEATSTVEVRLPAETLVSTIQKAADAAPTTLTFYAGSAAASAAAGGTTYYVNAYTGELMGTSSPRLRAFFRSVTDWHRYVALSGDSRAWGKSITGASNLIFLFIVVSGAFIWWRGAIAWFKKGLAGKALYFNWHHVFGVWAAVPLFLVVLSATVISYPWASNLVYRVTGSEPPAQSGGGGGGGRGGGNQNREGSRAAKVDLSGIDAAIGRAEGAVPDWRTLAVRLPADGKAPVSFTIDQRRAGQPQYRTTATVDRKTGEIATIERFSDQNLGRRTRSWMRYIHTGEYYGFIGQTIAGLASFAGVMLVWTGFALSLHRVFAWLKRRNRQTSATMDGSLILPEER